MIGDCNNTRNMTQTDSNQSLSSSSKWRRRNEEKWRPNWLHFTGVRDKTSTISDVRNVMSKYLFLCQWF